MNRNYLPSLGQGHPAWIFLKLFSEKITWEENQVPVSPIITGTYKFPMWLKKLKAAPMSPNSVFMMSFSQRKMWPVKKIGWSIWSSNKIPSLRLSLPHQANVTHSPSPIFCLLALHTVFSQATCLPTILSFVHCHWNPKLGWHCRFPQTLSLDSPWACCLPISFKLTLPLQSWVFQIILFDLTTLRPYKKSWCIDFIHVGKVQVLRRGLKEQ